MRRRRSCILIFLLGCATYATATEKDSLESYYIHKFSNYFFVGPLIKQQNFDFKISSPDNRDRKYVFKANNSVSLGAVVNIFDVHFEAAFSTSLNADSKRLFGSSDAKDLQVRILGKQWIADIFYQTYQGFYVASSQEIIPRGQPFPQRPDVATKNIGLSFAYAFNHKKFSLRAPYIFTERQKVSKGSWLIGYSFSSFTLSGDSSFVPSDQWATWGRGASIERARFTSLGFAPGYTHTFVLDKFFLNLLLILGPANYWIRYTEQNDTGKNDIRVDVYSAARIGIGYSGDKFFGGINVTGQTKNVNFDKSKFQNNTSIIRIVTGMRIREFGLLKKKPLDILRGK